ncbi:hypothetical protein F5Y10DRAFT_242831 [Nemania abortiva]|nr:hypothetical protein F5Y10DRAFT_242831 [Nemania abortiva]
MNNVQCTMNNEHCINNTVQTTIHYQVNIYEKTHPKGIFFRHYKLKPLSQPPTKISSSIISPYCPHTVTALSLFLMEKQQVFHLFPKLPAELRHAIWRAALNSPSLTEISFENGRLRSSAVEWDPSIVGQVCYEARWLMTSLLPRISFPFGPYINFTANVLHFGPAGTALQKIITRFRVLNNRL